MEARQRELYQHRAEVLRDLIVSKKNGVATGVAMDYLDELQRSEEDLSTERAEVMQELHAAEHEQAAQDLETRLNAESTSLREAVRELVGTHTPEEIAERRARVREDLLKLRAEYRVLSAAQQFIDAGARFKAMLDAASPEERDAFLATLQ